MYLCSVTIQNVEEQSHDLWRYQRFLIVEEFSKKTALPLPFNIIYHIFDIIRFIIKRILAYRNRRRYGTRIFLGCFHIRFHSNASILSIVTANIFLNDIKIADKSTYSQFKSKKKKLCSILLLCIILFSY